MNSRRVLCLAPLCVLLCVLTAEKVRACSCGPMPSVLDAFESADDVIIAQIKSVAKTGGGINQYHGYRGATLTVQRVFKGNLKPRNELFFEQGGGADCIWTFSEDSIGDTLLIYNSPYEGKRYIVACGRSRHMAGATDDLLYLENLDRVRGKTRISGKYTFGFSSNVPPGESVAGKTIRITGKQNSYVAVTDKDGVYELYDLPEGEYFVSAEIPRGWKVNQYMLERSSALDPSARYSADLNVDNIPVTVVAGKHLALDFQLEPNPDNAIKGRILDPQGKPMKGVCVAATDADANTDRFGYGPRGCSDERGLFKISDLPTSSFVLVINGDGEIDGREPIERLFYPGVAERSKATVIEMTMGKHLALGDFKVPKVVETVTLSGTLLYADGKPVDSQKVQFLANSFDPSRLADPYDYTDKQGRFEVRILKGQSGILRGEMIFGERHLVSCPDLKAAVVVENDGDGTLTVGTESVLIRGDRDRLKLKLKFAFPECERE